MRRVYRARKSDRILLVIFLVFLAAFALGAWRAASRGTNMWFGSAVEIAVLLAGAFAAIQGFSVQVVLSGDTISYESLLRKQSLHLHQICFRTEYEIQHQGSDGSVGYLLLIAVAAEVQDLEIQLSNFDFDAEFWQWIFQIPDGERDLPREPTPSLLSIRG